MQSRLISDFSDILWMDQNAWFLFHIRTSYRFWTTLGWISEFSIEVSLKIATGQSLKGVHSETFKIALVTSQSGLVFTSLEFSLGRLETQGLQCPQSPVYLPLLFVLGGNIFLSGCWDHKTTGAHVVLYSVKAFFDNRPCRFAAYVIYSPSCPLCYRIRWLPCEFCYTCMRNSPWSVEQLVATSHACNSILTLAVYSVSF